MISTIFPTSVDVHRFKSGMSITALANCSLGDGDRDTYPYFDAGDFTSFLATAIARMLPHTVFDRNSDLEEMEQNHKI